MKRLFLVIFLAIVPLVSNAATQAEAMASCQEAVPSYAFCVDLGPVPGNPTVSWIRQEFTAAPGVYTGVYYYTPAVPCEGVNDTISRSGEGALPPVLCNNGCAYTQVGVGVSFPSSNTWGADYTGTEQSCESGESGSPANPSAPNCVTSDSGNQACYNQSDSNCGTFNGDNICVTDVQPDNCLTASSGGQLCIDGASGSPDNGTPGVPADPDDSFQLGGSGPTNTQPVIDYFGPGTVADATNTGTPPPPVNTDEPAACDPATDPYQCQGAPQCGATGQPPCDVRIDESGTPSEFDFGGDDIGQSLIDQIGDAFDAPTVTSLPALPVPGGCQSVSLSIAGHSVQIPDTATCARLDQFKSLLGYFLYVATFFYVLRLATRSPV